MKSASVKPQSRRGRRGQDPLQQGVHLADGVLHLAAQDAGHQLLEAHDLSVGLVGVVVVHDGAEEHVVALAVGHVIGAAQGEAHAVDRAAARLQEGDACVEAGGDKLVHILEPGVLALLVDELKPLRIMSMAFSLKSSLVMVLRWGLRKDSVAWTRASMAEQAKGL